MDEKCEMPVFMIAYAASGFISIAEIKRATIEHPKSIQNTV
jgi:hypothetical protein